MVVPPPAVVVLVVGAAVVVLVVVVSIELRQVAQSTIVELAVFTIRSGVPYVLDIIV